MRTFRQFCDLPQEERVSIFEPLFRAALESLLPDLAAAPWYVREREVVNLFVFGHLVPQFQTANLDISQLGIEVPVLKLPKSSRAKLSKTEELSQLRVEAPSLEALKLRMERLSKSADIVVWPHARATVWQTCKPLVHVEWKNISCREENPRGLEQQHEDDIFYLKHNRSLVSVSYAVLTDQRDRRVEIRCKRIEEGKEPEDFFSAAFKCAATCSEKAVTDLQHGYPELLSRTQTCPICIPPSGTT